VLPWLFCEFLPRKFWPAVSQHIKNWQETGRLDDSLRLRVFNPLHLAIFHAHANGFAILDLKPDNVRFRENGRPVFIDLGLGHRFPADCGHGKQTAQGTPCMLTRECTTLIALEQAAASVRQAKPLPRGLMQSSKPKQGALFLSTPRSEIRGFWLRAGIHGLAKLADGTRGFVDSKLTTVMKAWRKMISGAGQKKLKALDRNFAFAADRYAVHRTLLLPLTWKKDETIAAWDARARKAAEKGADGIRSMLVDALHPGVTVQQEMALARMVDFFTLALGPDERFVDTADAMVHELNTLPFLPPDWDQALSRGDGMKLFG
jgi:hypothetical protein